jgi:uncharacterized protein (TIGR03435 family)
MRGAGLLPLVTVIALAQSFDVASVKLYKDDGKSPRNQFSYNAQGVTFRGCSLAFVVAEAYHVQPGRVVGPNSLTKQALWGSLTQGYDIVGKADHAVPKEQVRLMLQSLLAERFPLTMHREGKTGPVYKLVVAKGGPKLQAAEGGVLVMAGSSEAFLFRNAEVLRLAGYISSHVDRVVVDETGIEGVYNFVVRLPEDLRQNPDAKPNGVSPDSPSSAMFAEVLKPLGLQLISGTAPVEYLVVDRVERPSQN